MLRFLFICILPALLQAGEDVSASGNQIILGSDNTTSSTTSTITVAPLTTSVVPTPTVPVYNAMNGTDICLRVQMNIKLTVGYYTKQGSSVSKSFFLNSSSHDSTLCSGSCEENTESVRIQWWPEKSEPKSPSWGLEFKFKRLPSEGDGGHFSLDTVAFNYTVTDSLFPETNETVTRFTIIQQPQFSAPIGSFFQCMSKQTWKLSDVPDLPTNGSQPDVFVSTSNLKAEAFRASADQNFVGQKSECSADYVPNKVVPVVIGVALAIMIVIALITFIVGSRRRQSGYQEI